MFSFFRILFQGLTQTFPASVTYPIPEPFTPKETSAVVDRYRSQQRKALHKCYMEGTRRSLLQKIWNSDDLGTMREAIRQLPNMPQRHKARFSSALKQMSG
jgi:hypothetical protein